MNQINTMINNIQKTFIFLVFFSVTNNVFCAENQTTLKDLVPFFEKTRRLYEELQISYTNQAQTIKTQGEIIQFLQAENQIHTDNISQLNAQHNEQDKTITELLNTTKRLVAVVEKLTQNTQELKQTRTIINSPTGNNNHHNVVIQNTSAMSNVAVNGSSINTRPSGKALLFQLALIAAGMYVIFKSIKFDLSI